MGDHAEGADKIKFLYNVMSTKWNYSGCDYLHV